MPERLPQRFPGRVEELIYHRRPYPHPGSLLGHDDFIVKVPNRGRTEAGAAAR